MAHISGDDRSQLLLLPESVEDYVGPDDVVRFIDAFVDGLDLEATGFKRVDPKATGRPGYDPADLLKLYIYGYLNRVRSSRRLEAETHRNLEVIWLLRRLAPDFKTIADFRRDNRAAFRKVFREFVALCRELGLFGQELIAVDGSRIKAVNSRDRNFTQAKLQRELKRSDERLERYLKELDEADRDDDAGPGGTVERLQEKIASIKDRRARLEEARKALEESGEDQLSLTDPDARAMQSGTGVGVGYNVQIAVDTKHKPPSQRCSASPAGSRDRRGRGPQQGLRSRAAGRDGRGRAGRPRRGGDRGCRRPRLFQDRGHRGLREGRRHALCAEAGAWSRRRRRAVHQEPVSP